MRESILVGTLLIKTDLTNVNLTDATLRQADLTGAKLDGAKFRGANLQGAFLIKTPSLCNADLSECDLRGVDLHGMDLTNANLYQCNLSGANMRKVIMSGADLGGSDLTSANLSDADLSGARLTKANMSGATVSRADLKQANLAGAELSMADFGGAILSGADLSRSVMIETNLAQCVLTDVRVWGASVWDANLGNAVQRDLVITRRGQSRITVDDLEVSQFIYLLLDNVKIRNVITTITSKAVLILGRFTPEKKAILDAIREALRVHDYLPILFDFEKPPSRDLTETISTLAHLARFVIADLTDPRSIPQELTAVIPRLLSVPVSPILLGSASEWSMFVDLARYPQVLPPFYYANEACLLEHLENSVIGPAEAKAAELTGHSRVTRQI